MKPKNETLAGTGPNVCEEINRLIVDMQMEQIRSGIRHIARLHLTDEDKKILKKDLEKLATLISV